MSDIEDIVRRIVREEIDRRVPPPQPAPLVDICSKCAVCGIDFGLGPWSYACGHPKCPIAARCTS